MKTQEEKYQKKKSSTRFKLFKPASFALLMLLSVFSWQCKKDDFIATESFCPEVISTDPSNGATGVVLSKKIMATFNKQMNAATIDNTTFIVRQGATQIAGVVSYSGNTATFTPASFLALNTAYTATITTGAKDPEENALRNDYVWSFTTGTSSSSNQPQVISTDPVNGATGVALNKKITATFNKVMDPSTITSSTFLLTQGITPIAGVVSYTGTTAKFTPSSNLSPGMVYTATITTGAKDVAGNPLGANYVWNFTTGTTLDITPPTVISTDPADLATNVLLNKIVTAKFSESMDPATINSVTFTLMQGASTVPGAVSYSGITASYNPTSDLSTGTTYTATIKVGAEDLAGNSIVSDYVWTFTTGTSTGQGTVDLATAGNFAILAGAGITNTGLTIINGDAGTSPTGTVNGFPPGIVNGSINAADPIAAQAKLDLTAAYNDAQGRATGAISLPGDLSGLTLAPGLYTNASSVMLSAGNVTLDAMGDANAIFILQMGSTLTTNPGTGFILAGGAQAKNIFWSVGTSATLGTNSTFYGNILADQSISMNTGAILNGRALTRIGAVTLQSNQVNMP
ncbi:MAG: Ig-like domain-containing protein [Bacteroidota bacterium]|nr:Ig-like domain-containing protein [Bacteroidota bacterium]